MLTMSTRLERHRARTRTRCEEVVHKKQPRSRLVRNRFSEFGGSETPVAESRSRFHAGRPSRPGTNALSKS